MVGKRPTIRGEALDLSDISWDFSRIYNNFHIVLKWSITHEISDRSHEISEILLYMQYPMGYIQIACVSETGVYCTPICGYFHGTFDEKPGV